jgi:hypothetical protein
MIGFGDFKYRKNFVRPLVLAIAVSFLLAWGHVEFGTTLQQTLSAEELLTLDSYVFTLSTLIGLLIPVGYYLRTRDVTESIAITLALAWALLISGLEDVFVYLLHPDSLPAELPWLEDGIIGAWAHLIGVETVTDTALISWILVSGVITVVLIEGLYEFEEYGL